MATLPELLKTVLDLDGSDLHLTTQTPPQIRVHGKLQTLDLPALGPSDTKALAYSVLTDAQKKRFEESLELDFSFGIRGLARFRCNVFNQRGAVAKFIKKIHQLRFGRLDGDGLKLLHEEWIVRSSSGASGVQNVDTAGCLLGDNIAGKPLLLILGGHVEPIFGHFLDRLDVNRNLIGFGLPGF